MGYIVHLNVATGCPNGFCLHTRLDLISRSGSDARSTRYRYDLQKAMKHASAKSAAEDYRKRLLYQCEKDLHKQAKIVKKFHCQKVIRSLKKQENTQMDKPSTKVEEWRRLNLDQVVTECFKRLGVLDLLGEDKQRSIVPVDDEIKLEKIMSHKVMRAAIEKWSLSIIEFRKWMETHDDETGTGEAINQDINQPELDELVSSSKSLFSSLQEAPSQRRKKKNRKGQKARRAKAIAIEARKQGKTIERSSNWRDSRSQQQKTQSSKQQPSSTTTTEEQDQAKPEELHPSWHASKAQKTNIVAFQGKKITFSD